MIHFRALSRGDSDRITRHLLDLGPADRRARFHGTLDEASLSQHVAGIDWSVTEVIGAFEDGALIGLAEICFDRRWMPAHAELAVTVLPDHQGQGIGQRLCDRAVLVARNRAAPHLLMQCLAHNQPMRRIALRLAGRIEASDGVAESAVPLAPPTLLSLWQQGLTGAGDWIARW